MLCTCFAVLAVLIACVGLYGMMAYNVARRTNEIGIRMVIGAQRRRLIWMVLREVLLMAVVGLAIGLPTVFATSRLVQSFLFRMKPNDPVTLTVAAVALLGAAVLAGYGPAWRASRVDPWTALRANSVAGRIGRHATEFFLWAAEYRYVRYCPRGRAIAGP